MFQHNRFMSNGTKSNNKARTFLVNCLFCKLVIECSVSARSRNQNVNKSNAFVCGVQAVRRACGAVVFVVAYFPAFCENIISKFLFALILTNAGNTLLLHQWFCMTRIHFTLVYNADIKKNKDQTQFWIFEVNSI